MKFRYFRVVSLASTRITVEYRSEIVKSGTWFYDSSIRYQVWIVRQNFDYYYEKAFDTAPDLNLDGETFMVMHGQGDEEMAEKGQYLSRHEAMMQAQAAVPHEIEWDDQRVGMRLERLPMDGGE